MERLDDTFVHAIMMKIEARLCNELECVYNDMTNKIVENKGKLTNEDVIEFQKKNYMRCTTRMLLFVKKLLVLKIPRSGFHLVIILLKKHTEVDKTVWCNKVMMVC